tara:strand:+ start:135 stop:446 length:312 start_codon:yes stop_codon:yes gene_type:complete
MGKKNWIEFDNHENICQEKPKEENFKNISKLNISKQKKGKKGKTITLIKGLGIENEREVKDLLKKMKVFCGTGGTVIGEDIQLQGDMVFKSIEFLRNEGFQNL